MQTFINLQEPFTYSVIPLIITSAAVIAITCYLIYLKKIKRKSTEEIKVKEIPERNIKNVPVIKGKYLKQLEKIEDKYEEGTIELRKAYQMISEAVRLFVFEITDITTQNYSLVEIKRLGMPNLYKLIEEYYEPEFASKSIGDFKASINKARRVIDEWN